MIKVAYSFHGYNM